MKVSEKLPLVRNILLANMKAPDAEVDRFGHIKFTRSDGRKMRYKFQQQTIRLEAQVTHEATRYSAASKEWVRMKTFNINKVYANMVEKGDIVK